MSTLVAKNVYHTQENQFVFVLFTYDRTTCNKKQLSDFACKKNKGKYAATNTIITQVTTRYKIIAHPIAATAPLLLWYVQTAAQPDGLL